MRNEKQRRSEGGGKEDALVEEVQGWVGRGRRDRGGPRVGS